MSELSGARLDDAYDALRSWCHERPDLDDPSTVYTTYGTVTAIIATLQHIVCAASRSVARATGADDDRTITSAIDDVDTLTSAATQSLEEAHRTIAEAHGVVSHLIFAIDDTRRR